MPVPYSDRKCRTCKDAAGFGDIRGVGLKRIYRQFVVILFAASCLLFAGISQLYYIQIERDAGSRLEQILLVVENRYRLEKKNQTDKMKILREDYVNRAVAITYILEHSLTSEDRENLDYLRKVMDVEKINVIDENGVVTASADSGAAGSRVYEHAGSEKIMDLAGGRIDGPVAVLGEYAADGSRLDDYVAVRKPGGGVLQITYPPDAVDEAAENAHIGYVLETLLTEYNITVAAVDDSGNVIGMTKDNDQELHLDGLESKEELLTELRKTKEGRTVRLNGGISYVLSRRYQDLTLCIHYDMDQDIAVFAGYMAALAAMFVSVALLVLLLRHLIRINLMNDFRRMEEDIDKFLAGDAGHEIRFSHNPELMKLNRAVQKMRESYRHRSERISRIVGGLDSGVAAFECLRYTNLPILTDNFRQILSLTAEEYRALSTSARACERFLRSLEEEKSGDGLLGFRGKWLEMTTYCLDNEYFGLIYDRTGEHIEREKAKESLKAAEKSAGTDAMTGLYTRAHFEKRIGEYLENSGSSGGVLLVMDMDNFKTVNDTLGHPEGDRAIKIMASCLKKEFRKSDITGRLGGDEFVVFMPGVIPRHALKEKLERLLDKLREALADYRSQNVTASIGVSFADGGEMDYRTLYEAGDTALYIAKELGKNRFYINEENIRCMERVCRYCRRQCPRREALGLDKRQEI